uniref:BTB domain-containing protein n=1 Tax=Timema monikensis TaxID=170555 RepID=A0A7R9E0F7_9NEOP|nr:unnamed protein product [Timema monikensis]
MDNEQPHQELVKCVVVGDTAVGKTRLICARACNKQVSMSQLLTTHVPTVWAIDQYRIYKDVLERSWEMVDGVNVSLRLWDTFGDHEKDRRFAYGRSVRRTHTSWRQVLGHDKLILIAAALVSVIVQTHVGTHSTVGCRSDVVLLCFSITNPVSLRNCKAMWYPEIRRFCPQTPILLVGCKSDLRYMYKDEAYLSFFRDRSPFVRPTRKSDLMMPDQARAIAKELGIHYYETSVLTYYGVNDVFENAIRAALIARRGQRFWMTNLKKVQRPLLQAPFLPPKPVPTELYIAGSTYTENMQTLWLTQTYTDIILVAGSVGFSAHRFMLAAASPAFHRLLTMDLNSDMGARSSSESSMVSTFGEATMGDFNDDTEYLIRQSDNYFKPSRVWEQLKRRSSCQVLSTESNKKIGVSKDLNHPAFQTIRLEQCESFDTHRGRPTSSVQTVLTLSKLVTPQAMQQCLQFLYTGTIDSRFCELQVCSNTFVVRQEIRQAAEFLDLPELLVFVTNIQSHEEFLNTDLKQQYRKRLQDLCLGQGLFSDIVFQLDDGSFAAHRPMLMARCDMMKAMFSGDFRESNAKVILFPGVHEDTFHKLLVYLYIDDVPTISPARCLGLLELANRLCLPRLVNLVERRVVEELSRISAVEGSDVVEHCLRLLEPCKIELEEQVVVFFQLHNADQLADWCMNHLCTNYNKLCKMSPKLLKGLHPENQEYLCEHRWPPVWSVYKLYQHFVDQTSLHASQILSSALSQNISDLAFCDVGGNEGILMYLKDFDYYQKCAQERAREEKPLLKRSRHNSGCLCFTSNKSRRGGVSERPLLAGNTV